MYNFMPVAESVQIFAVGFDDLLIPPERILSLSVHVTVTIVITIYIDKRFFISPVDADTRSVHPHMV